MLKRVKIGDLGDIYTGNTPSKKNIEFYDSEDIMFIKPDILEFNISKIEKANEYISEKAREKARIIPKGSLLVSCIGNIGKLGINNEEVAFNQQINAIVHNDKIISSKYLAYVLKHNQKKLESIANAAVVPIINKNQFSEFELLIHEDLEIQNKIVTILDKSQGLIDKRKEQIEALDQLVKSHFIEMFGDVISNKKNYPIKKLDEITSIITDGTHQTPTYVDKGYIFLSSKNVTTGKINWDDVKYIPEELHIKLNKRLEPKLNDILLAKNGTTGVAALVDRECIFDIYVSLALIRFNSNINPVFMLYMINSDGCRHQFNSSLKGIGVPNLHLSEIRKTKVLLPPIELQNQFADFVKQVDKLKFEMENSLKELEDNFNSLMQKSFNGELF